MIDLPIPDWAPMAYPWIKALHVIAVISWMAGMLYLPRLYVYHVQAGLHSRMAETFQIMEKRLLRIIVNPAMIVTWLAGGAMLWLNPSLLSEGWMHGKLGLLVLMQVAHAFYARWRRQLANGTCGHSERFFRIVNEIPAVLMIGIVILVIVRPF